MDNPIKDVVHLLSKHMSPTDICTMRLVCKVWRRKLEVPFKKILKMLYPKRCVVLIGTSEIVLCPFEFNCPIHGLNKMIN